MISTVSNGSNSNSVEVQINDFKIQISNLVDQMKAFKEQMKLLLSRVNKLENLNNCAQIDIESKVEDVSVHHDLNQFILI